MAKVPPEVSLAYTNTLITAAASAAAYFIIQDRMISDDISSSETETVATGYSYTMNLNTSFTGDDNLYVRLKAGDDGAQWNIKESYHIDSKDTDSSFNVDKMWYTLPVGDNLTVIAGPRIENYYMYVTPSIYRPGALKSFKLGGNSNFGASTDVGFGFKYEADNGFALASNIVDKGGMVTGLLGEAGAILILSIAAIIMSFKDKFSLEKVKKLRDSISED